MKLLKVLTMIGIKEHYLVLSITLSRISLNEQLAEQQVFFDKK